jgi:glutamate N-acetyltransferase/amino-acid N-acetyltransferase
VSVTAPAGFLASGVVAGLKSSGLPDVAIVRNLGPLHAAAAVFTSNRVVAAPVLWSRQAVADGRVDAVVINAGGANACTGPAGFADTHLTAEHTAAALGVSSADVVVCSTGVIGQRLPMDLLLPGVSAAAAALSSEAGELAAEAIRTTDTHAKQAVVTGEGWSVGAMGKGAAMLAPGLATMLVVITTDAVAEPAVLDAALRAATAVTFDRVDSDGCTSTNDTVLLMASGASGVSPSTGDLTAAVTAVCRDLALQMVGDAEGASKDITIEVTGAASEADALEVARAIARNNLLMCALYGNDPYWGRVLAAIGVTGAEFDPTRLAVAFNGVWVCREGHASDLDGTADITSRQLTVSVDLGAGDASAWVWTNDLTDAYVHENSAYTT